MYAPTLVLLHERVLRIGLFRDSEIRKVGYGGVEMSKSTSSRVETPEEKELRTTCANQLLVATMEWLNLETVAADTAIAVISGPWSIWMGMASKDIRSFTGSARVDAASIRDWYYRCNC